MSGQDNAHDLSGLLLVLAVAVVWSIPYAVAGYTALRRRRTR